MLTRQKAYSVSAITRIIKSTLEESFQSIWVEGEVSGYLHHSSGHRYLNLKDDRAVIKVTIWRSAGAKLKFEPKNGLKVLVFGDISVYEKGGNYQLNCRRLETVGIGDLELAFRQLHEKLLAEGLFDQTRKKPLPAFPKTIGIVTSPTGAAIRDIIQIARRRNPSVQLIIYPAQVQGDGAEKTIAAGVDYFNTRSDIDVIITGRGGGSLEDLWPFNTETTVRAIAASRIPVVSAVGHEIDTTLSDLAADLRAPTPSAAAELTVWSRADFEEQVESYLATQAYHLESLVAQAGKELRALLSRPIFARPSDQIRQRQQFLDSLSRHLERSGKNLFQLHRNRLSLVLSKLDTLSPLKILTRGYSVTRLADTPAVVKSVEQIAEGQRIESIVTDGTVISVVEKKTRQNFEAV